MRFDEIDFEDEVLDGLYDMNFEEMTPVQEATIPVILEGSDLIACAQTGTGKTAAYTLPLLNKLLVEGNEDNVVKTLVVVPTRELAMQIDTQLQGFSYYMPVSTTVVYGGGDGRGWEQQKQGMLRGADVVIATPGRLIAHLQNSGVDLSHVKYFVLDEADRMLDMGFFDDIMTIVRRLPAERQTLMFSATLPPKIRELARQILRKPVEINIAVSKPNEAIEQGAYVLYETQKLGLIKELFAKPLESKTIIFSSSKLKVKELAFAFKRMHLNAAAMHDVSVDFTGGLRGLGALFDGPGAALILAVGQERDKAQQGVATLDEPVQTGFRNAQLVQEHLAVLALQLSDVLLQLGTDGQHLAALRFCQRTDLLQILVALLIGKAVLVHVGGVDDGLEG